MGLINEAEWAPSEPTSRYGDKPTLVRFVHKLEELVDDRLEELPVGAEEAWVEADWAPCEPISRCGDCWRPTGPHLSLHRDILYVVAPMSAASSQIPDPLCALSFAGISTAQQFPPPFIVRRPTTNEGRAILLGHTSTRPTKYSNNMCRYT